MLSINFAALVLTGCMEPEMQRNPQTIGGRTIGPERERPGGFKQNPGESYPYPEIIYQEFVPSNVNLDEMKCLTWRITWPLYDSDFNDDLIPTVLSVTTGELNSIQYLNNTDPHNTFKTTLSLYLNRKLYASNDMLPYLDHLDHPGGIWDNEWTYFKKGNVPLDELMYWVQEWPKAFKYEWPTDEWFGSKIDYQEGDFIHFWMGSKDQYGGIRIVSDTPRIIEVYLAVENN
jgi:hypothetical protein